MVQYDVTPTFLLPSTLTLQQYINSSVQLCKTPPSVLVQRAENRTKAICLPCNTGAGIYVLSVIYCCVCLYRPLSLHAYQLPDLPQSVELQTAECCITTNYPVRCGQQSDVMWTYFTEATSKTVSKFNLLELAWLYLKKSSYFFLS